MPVTSGSPPLGQDPASGMPSYRGRSLEGLQGEPFERVWGLLVDGDPASTLPPAEPFSLPVRTGDVRADVQTALGHLGPVWAFRPIIDITSAQARADLARASVLTLSLVAQAARGAELPAVPQQQVDRSESITARFLVRWHGHADPVAVRALDTVWLLVAEQGLVRPTQVARLVAGTGADAAACLSAAAAALAGPLAGGAAARSLALLHRAEELGDARAAVAAALTARPNDPGLPGFTVNATGTETGAQADARARARLMHAVCARLDTRLLEVAEATEQAMSTELEERRPGATVTADLMYWTAVLLNHLDVPPRLFTAMVVCGSTAGWSAHVLDVQRSLA
ncbi:citrate/2-methylcitrate synthase [Georgenia sp. 10Sc9-8]|uniref:citrate synthase (unknown stereospecificity) n=1 Tax=Georgenia halotolerans TaxID=3028317 RepID=A0ABT5U0S5_9MICO|nr:citrate/2-methylcitrate synthase [Georgenia halotolerans]